MIRWLSFWAVGTFAPFAIVIVMETFLSGWGIAAQNYCTQILQICTTMLRFRWYILPENRSSVDYYLDRVWKFVAALTMSLQPPQVGHERLYDEFSAYDQQEKERIKRSLGMVQCRIDALDTVYVVAGPGRIETVSASQSTNL